MNVNKQNNRCGTPTIISCGNRPIGRGVVRPGGVGGCPTIPMPCQESCVPCPTTTVCQEECNVATNTPCSTSCNSCSDNTNFGVVISGCGTDCNKETMLNGMALAMAYVPWQPYGNLYSLCEAVRQGTIFKDLDFEFMGRRCN